MSPEFPPSSACNSGSTGTLAGLESGADTGAGADETPCWFSLVRLGGAADATCPAACLLRMITRGTARPTQKPAVCKESVRDNFRLQMLLSMHTAATGTHFGMLLEDCVCAAGLEANEVVVVVAEVISVD